jgi:hypothetical protein
VPGTLNIIKISVCRSRSLAWTVGATFVHQDAGSSVPPSTFASSASHVTR